jgi:hypothetical protein
MYAAGSNNSLQEAKRLLFELRTSYGYQIPLCFVNKLHAEFAKNMRGSVADPDPGSDAFLTRTQDPEYWNRFFPDPGSRIPKPHF